MGLFFDVVLCVPAMIISWYVLMELFLKDAIVTSLRTNSWHGFFGNSVNYFHSKSIGSVVTILTIFLLLVFIYGICMLIFGPNLSPSSNRRRISKLLEKTKFKQMQLLTSLLIVYQHFFVMNQAFLTAPIKWYMLPTKYIYVCAPLCLIAYYMMYMILIPNLDICLESMSMIESPKRYSVTSGRVAGILIDIMVFIQIFLFWNTDLTVKILIFNFVYNFIKTFSVLFGSQCQMIITVDTFSRPTAFFSVIIPLMYFDEIKIRYVSEIIIPMIIFFIMVKYTHTIIHKKLNS